MYVNATQGFLRHHTFDSGALSHRGSGNHVHARGLGGIFDHSGADARPIRRARAAVYGAAGKRGLVTRSLYSLGGMLLIGAIGGIFSLSMEQAPAMLPIFVAGAGVGIVAVLTQAPKRA